MRKKKVAIIGTVGIPAKYGGFETLTEQLVNNLHSEFDFTVYCSGLSYKNREEYPLARRVFIPLDANGKSSIVYDFISIIHAVFYADVILLLGVSAAFMIPFIKLFSKTKVITNIDGLEWKREKWTGFAKVYLKYQEKIAVKRSHIVVSDNLAIQEYVTSDYKRKTSCIAYGASHVKEVQKKETKEKYAFSVCRIEPENNVHIILEAFSETDKKIVFVGNWDTGKYGREVRSKYKKFPNIEMLDPIYDQERLDDLRANCHVYIHGHSAGGTNPSLVEAMWLGLPVICWDVVYNRETTSQQALFFGDKEALKTLLDSDEKVFKEVAAKLKSLAYKNYNWEKIASQYKEHMLGHDQFSLSNQPKITGTIVLYKNDVEMLRKAIESFLSTPVEKKLFLVDNSPSDRLRYEFDYPEVEYIYIGQNVGYGRGNNYVSKFIESNSTYHLVLNPDVYFDSKVILELIKELEKDDNLSVIAPKTLYPDGIFQHSCRRYPSFLELLFRRLRIFKAVTDKGEYKDLDLSRPFYPDFIQGAFLLFRTSEYIKLGGFDKRYFMYMEDVDICRKIDQTQKRKLYYPEVLIYHHYTKGSAKNLKLFFHHFLSAIQYFYKWTFAKNTR
jgi:GT2 family glycosyltransferase/glycosyltransferase involved in cell wall biosynthesis